MSPVARRRLARAAAGAALAAGAAAQGALAAPPLPRLGVQPGSAAVAGVSSGGAMAVQLHVAYSATFGRGAGVFAGVPYDCARDSALRATTQCMQAVPSPPDVDASIRATQARAQAGLIDPLEHLAKSRAYLFSGTNDSVVRQPVMDALYAYYRHYLPEPSIVYNNTTPAAHAWVSAAAPQACDVTGRLFLNHCAGVDAAEQMLATLYGPLSPRASAPLRGRLVEFDQKEFVPGRDPARHSLAGSGWAFVPADCAAGGCRLLVALHGCLQNQAKVGDAFVRQSGLNEWAESNRLVVLYPQTIAKLNGNPQACWDWWGYTGQDYVLKSGAQMRTVKAMVDRVGEPPRRGDAGGAGRREEAAGVGRREGAAGAAR